MEKSMIQDLDNMRVSIGYKNTFTTSFHGGGYQLKKSKISNLPSHKKSDLSVRLPFIVIFQTMQIQRLSQQIEALRVALKDMQRQAFNCQSYEIQIRQLTDQCHEYDIQLLQYKQQTQKLNMVSQKLYEQLQEWKQKYQNFDPLISQKFLAKQQQCQNLQNQLNKWRDRHRALQKSKQQQLEDLKLSMESQRKSVLDRQMRQLNIKFETQRGYLQGQIRKLQETVDQRDAQLTNIRFETEALRIQNEVNLDANRKLKESENKLNKSAQQLVRINQLLRRKQQQIQRKDSNQDYLKQLIKTLQRQKIAHQNQAIKVPQLQGAIKQWIARFSRLENQNNQNKQHLLRIPILQRDLENYNVQVQRLGTIIKGKMNQLSQSNTKAQKYRYLYEQSKKSEQKVPSLERKINQMNYQAERLNDILKKRLIQLEQAKNRTLILQKALRVFEQAQPDKKRIQQQYRRQIRQIQKLKKQIFQLEKQLRKIPQLESILEDQRNVRQEYARQVERLNKVVKQKSDQVQVGNQKVYHLQNKIKQLENIEEEIVQFKNQNNRIVQQIDSLGAKIKQKSQQVDQYAQLIVRLQNNLQQYKCVEQKLKESIQNTQRIIEQLNKTKNQLQAIQHSLFECEGELSEAKNTIIDINNEKEMISRNLNLKSQQLQHAKAQINQCIQLIQQLRQIQRDYHIVKQQYRLTQNQLRQTQQSLKNQKAKNQQLQYKNEMLINQMEKIRINGYFPEEFIQAFSQIKASATQKQRQIQNLLKKQISMEKSADQLHGMIATICETIKVKRFQWQQINSKLSEAVENIKKMQKLEDEVNSLKIQNIQLESQIKVLNLQMVELQSKKANNNVTSSNGFSSLANPIVSLKNTQSQVSSSSGSWNFNTVPSKKAIDAVVQDKSLNQVSKTLRSSNVINLNTASNMKSKLQQLRSTSKLSKLGNENSKPSHVNSVSSYNFNINPSYSSINSARGVLSSGSGFVSPAKLSTNISKQSTESYFTSKISKTNSITQPLSFKTSFRG